MCNYLLFLSSDAERFANSSLVDIDTSNTRSAEWVIGVHSCAVLPIERSTVSRRSQHRNTVPCGRPMVLVRWNFVAQRNCLVRAVGAGVGI